METVKSLLPHLALCAAVACGLLGGMFFAFSNFIMKAFALLPVPSGASAMQSINRTVLNPLFLSIFLGTGLASALTGLAALSQWQRPGAGFLLAGAVLYLAGGFLVTTARNVPLNNALAAIDPETAEGGTVWRDYLERWTRWNHVRTAACLAACGCFIAAHGRMD